MSQNRRKYIRIDSGNIPCRVTIGQTCYDATLINESIYGLGIGGLIPAFLGLDQHVVVEYEAEKILGKCRSAARDTDGQFQIGILKSDDDPLTEFSQTLINSYVEFSGTRIICSPVQEFDNGQIRIQLLDGKEFTLPRSKIVQLTRNERKEELKDDLLGVGRLMKIYEALNSDRCWTSERDILEHEFGPSSLVLASSR